MKYLTILLALGVLWAGAARGQTGGTTITSDALTFDYKRSIATFEGNVKVVDPQMKMDADKLTLLLDSTNSIKSITATGRVKIVQMDKTATCSSAVYVAKTGEVTLKGNVVVIRAGESLQSEEVIFWVNEDRMKCPGQSKLSISQDSQGGKAPRLGLGN
jgi:lipopolysaccharide transport protein LptA